MPRKVEAGCLRHPGAPTISSQFLDGGRSYGWQIVAAMSPHAEGRKNRQPSH